MQVAITPDAPLASRIQALEFEALDSFLEGVARHLGAMRPEHRPAAAKQLKIAIAADIDLVLIEVALGDDISACVPSNQQTRN
jgi:hypothetical protein